jgi:DNA-binding transcriptional regulator YdaS (Cro superfamily)
MFGVLFAKQVWWTGMVDPISKAVEACGSEAELARRLGGKVRGGHIYYWRRSGSVPLDRCAAIESATLGKVRCEDLRPDVQWQRDPAGRVTGYLVPVNDPPSAPDLDVQEAA